MRAQSSIEASMILTMMILVLMIFMGVAANKVVEETEKKDRELLENLGFVLSKEVAIAAAAEEGYFRVFELPTQLKGKNYTITIRKTKDQAEVEFSYQNHLENYQYLTIIPSEFNGQICPGANLITKKGADINSTCFG